MEAVLMIGETDQIISDIVMFQSKVSQAYSLTI